MAKKKPTPINTLIVGAAIGTGVSVFMMAAAEESMAVRIGSSVLASALTALVIVGALAVFRKVSKK